MLLLRNIVYNSYVSLEMLARLPAAWALGLAKQPWLWSTGPGPCDLQALWHVTCLPSCLGIQVKAHSVIDVPVGLIGSSPPAPPSNAGRHPGGAALVLQPPAGGGAGRAAAQRGPARGEPGAGMGLAPGRQAVDPRALGPAALSLHRWQAHWPTPLIASTPHTPALTPAHAPYIPAPIARPAAEDACHVRGRQHGQQHRAAQAGSHGHRMACAAAGAAEVGATRGCCCKQCWYRQLRAQ